MKHTTKTALAATTAALAAFICQPSAQAQTADSLIDKLVEKGVLTVKEGQALREESDKDFTRAYSAKSGMPEWVTAMKFNGDLRLRYDTTFGGGTTTFRTNDRYRYRLRFGFNANLMDDMEVGFRLASGDSGADPISTNQSLGGNANKKDIGIDMAFAKWNAINSADWSLSLTGGKMENPFKFSDAVFDGDYTPEGLAEEIGFLITPDQKATLALGQFIIADNDAGEGYPALFVAQLRWDAKWTEKWNTAMAVGGYHFMNRDNLGAASAATAPVATTTVRNIQAGNAEVAVSSTTIPTQQMMPFIANLSATYTLESAPYYAGAFPITALSEFIKNGAASEQNSAWQVGMVFGKSGKKGTWEISSRYKDLGANAVWSEMSDSDFGAIPLAPRAGYGAAANAYYSGTGVRGFVNKFTYSPYDSLAFTVAWFNTESVLDTAATRARANRIQFDAVWKF